MAIHEFTPEGTPRARIAFVGDLPQAEQLDRFKERNFHCVSCTPEGLRRAGYAAQLDAVIWTQDPKKLNTLPRELRTVAANLLNYDVRIYIRLATARSLVVNTLIEGAIPVANLRPYEWQAIPESLRERENGFLMPCVFIFESASSWADVAALVCDRPAGPSPKSELKVDERFLRKRFGAEGHPERVMLLKRAFWSCSELQLTLLDGGLSGAPVFKAYASLAAGFGLVQRGATGAYPHLYFVKNRPSQENCGRVRQILRPHI